MENHETIFTTKINYLNKINQNVKYGNLHIACSYVISRERKNSKKLLCNIDDDKIDGGIFEDMFRFSEGIRELSISIYCDIEYPKIIFPSTLEKLNLNDYCENHGIITIDKRLNKFSVESLSGDKFDFSKVNAIYYCINDPNICKITFHKDIEVLEILTKSRKIIKSDVDLSCYHKLKSIAVGLENYAKIVFPETDIFDTLLIVWNYSLKNDNISIPLSIKKLVVMDTEPTKRPTIKIPYGCKIQFI